MVPEDVVSLNSSGGAEKKLACEKKLVIASEVPLRNKALNYGTCVSASPVPGCCGGWEAQRGARAGESEARWSSAGCTVLVRCGDVVGHTQLGPSVPDQRNEWFCAERPAGDCS